MSLALDHSLIAAASASLPVTMDGQVEDDDLFGNATPIYSKQLQQRLDDLRRRGCCQSIVWSKQGTITSISPDGRFLELRFLRCRPSDGSWEMSAPTSCHCLLSTTLTSSVPLTHLAWATAGLTELAVIDAVGRVCIIHFSTSLNRPASFRRWEADSANDVNAIVGCYWLPPSHPGRPSLIFAHGPAVRDGSAYKYENSVVGAAQPGHPSKSAFVCLSTNGILRIFLPQVNSQNSRLDEASLELETVSTSDDLITHASITACQNTLLVAYVTAANVLRVARVDVQWTAEKQASLHVPLLHPPSLRERRLATEPLVEPLPEGDGPITHLSHVECLPALCDQSGNVRAPPMVLIVKSSVPGPHDTHPAQSVIDRYQIIEDEAESLHPIIIQLGAKRGVTGVPKPTTRLRKIDSIQFSLKVIVSLHTTHLGKGLCMAFSDGTVQTCDRVTMEETLNEVNFERISMPSQVGFIFGQATPCLQVALSPTNCSFVQLSEDGKVRWNRMSLPTTLVGDSMQDMQYAAIVASATVSLSTATIQQSSFDDILALIRPFTGTGRFAYHVVAEMIRTLKVTVDYSDDAKNDQLVRNLQLQLCLSVLNHLGFRGEFHRRSFGSKFARLALNIREIVILITLASKTSAKDNPLDEPEVVETLAGCMKWAVLLVAWVSDALFCLADNGKFMALVEARRFDEMMVYLEAQNEVVLHLLLSSCTRGLLATASRRVTELDLLSKRATDYYAKKGSLLAGGKDATGEGGRARSQLYTAYHRMYRNTSSSMVKIIEFERLLNTLAIDIRKAYQAPPAPQAGVVDVAAQARMNTPIQSELSMLLGQMPPPHVLGPVISRLLKRDVLALKAHVNRSGLYFADYSLLEADDNVESLDHRRHANMRVDVFNRAILNTTTHHNNYDDGGGDSGASLRRCVRCAAVMEDVVSSRQGFISMLANRPRCLCGGNWAHV